MNLFKKLIFLCLFLSIFSFTGCNLASNKNKLPDVKPKDFNFVFNYGVNSKNGLNTIKGEYTKDMVIDPSITTNLILSNEEMNSIYLDMKKINILNYPENYNPKSSMRQTPFQTYSIKIVIDGKEKKIYWEDENVSKTKEAIILRELFKKIQEIIINKEEYKKLPPANGGYD